MSAFPCWRSPLAPCCASPLGLYIARSSTLAAFINAGGLGTLLFMGVSQGHSDKIIASAVGVSALALAANALMRALEARAVRAAHGNDKATTGN